jgi:hypothetical protein
MRPSEWARPVAPKNTIRSHERPKKHERPRRLAPHDLSIRSTTIGTIEGSSSPVSARTYVLCFSYSSRRKIERYGGLARTGRLAENCRLGQDCVRLRWSR